MRSPGEPALAQEDPLPGPALFWGVYIYIYMYMYIYIYIYIWGSICNPQENQFWRKKILYQVLPCFNDTESVCEVVLKKIPNKSVNLSLAITNLKNKVTDLCGNWLLQNDLMNTFCAICFLGGRGWGQGGTTVCKGCGMRARTSSTRPKPNP